MGKFGDALREKFPDPREVLRLLGLDENLISRENLMATKAPSKFANFAMQLVARAIEPVLAKDAKIDLMPVFKDVTAKSFKAAPVKMALDAALKNKLIAKDAEPTMGHVATLLDHIEHVAGEGRDESVSPEQHKAMEAAAHGESNLGIPKKVGAEFAKKDDAEDKKFGWDEEKVEGFKKYMRENGVGEDEIAGACDALGLGAARMPGGAGDEETPEQKAEREKKEADEKKAAEDKRMADDKKAAEDKRMADDKVSRPAMDAAIKAASAATAKQVRETERKIRIAMDEVKPWVGEFRPDMAFDTEADVFRQALVMRGVEGAETMHADALRPVLVNLPKPGSERRDTNNTPNLGMDENAVSDVHKMFPGLDRIQAA